ncbi:hypothetical protein MSAN_00834100 [Mycena sanguinolenta]|uniref:DUF6534 domain-containing protein n=1 Tax=Mycena sanguinolenta TaxID=230812 RepID=A0A8H6YWG5_9AGAR|nr:hypothetical protein MSAN_00834100 [Mycena sanguinolenta]
MSSRLFIRELSANDYTRSGWDLAICVSLFFQGVLCAQFAHYMTLSKRDSIWLKLFVTGLAVLSVARCCQCLAIMWMQNVTLFPSVEAASTLWLRHWVPKSNIMLEATGALYVQIFFSRRLWASAISRNAYIVTICLIFFALGLVTAVVGTVCLFVNRITWTAGLISLHLGLVLCGDSLLTASTVFYLLRHYNASILSRSPFAIKMKLLVRLTIQSAAPAAICTFINLVADMRLFLDEIEDPRALMAAFILIIALPQLYAWSAMWTLNSREDIWVAVDNRTYTVNLATSAVLADLRSVRGPHVGEVPFQGTQNNFAPSRENEKLLSV